MTQRWHGPIGFEGVATGDRRYINVGGLNWATLPLPLRYVGEDVGAHDGASISGNIDKLERRDGILDAEGNPIDGMPQDGTATIWAEGELDMDGSYGVESARLLGKKLMNGVSMDLDDISFEVLPGTDFGLTANPEDDMMVTIKARIRAATQVAIPAFEGARIALDAEEIEVEVAVSEVLATEAPRSWSFSARKGELVATKQNFSYNPLQLRDPGSGQWMPSPYKLIMDLETALTSTGALGDSKVERLLTQAKADSQGLSATNTPDDVAAKVQESVTQILDAMKGSADTASTEAIDAAQDGLDTVESANWSNFDPMDDSRGGGDGEASAAPTDTASAPDVPATPDAAATPDATQPDATATATPVITPVTPATPTASATPADATPADAAPVTTVPGAPDSQITADDFEAFITSENPDEDVSKEIARAKEIVGADTATEQQWLEAIQQAFTEADPVDTATPAAAAASAETFAVGVDEGLTMYPDSRVVFKDVLQALIDAKAEPWQAPSNQFELALNLVDLGMTVDNAIVAVLGDDSHAPVVFLPNGDLIAVEDCYPEPAIIDYWDDDWAAITSTFNWVDDVGGLPLYIKSVANAILRTNPEFGQARAIATAVSQIKRWAHGGEHVSAETVAKSAATLVEWEAKKLAAHVTSSSVTAMSSHRQYQPEERGSLVASGATQLAAPIKPPKAWFDRPQFTGPTPLTVTKEGRVYGHLATWDACHLAMPNGANECVVAPHSPSGYGYFNLGVVETAEGDEVTVGRLTMKTGHADDWANMRAALAHYENTGMAIADVHAGEDEYGVWFAGALRPDATPAQIRAFKASPLSGDWRSVPGRPDHELELVMGLAVNMPGFRVPRPKGLIASGGMKSLMAVGMIAPKIVLKPGTPDALSSDDLHYLKSMAARERFIQAEELRARAELASARFTVTEFVSKNRIIPTTRKV